jgi:hypothetical protein
MISEKKQTSIDFSEIKRAAFGRWSQIIPALTSLPASVLKKGRKQDHPCPQCGGASVIWPGRKAEDTGSIACRKCTDNKQTGDGIGTVAKWNGICQLEAAKQVADFLGIKIDSEPTEKDLVEEICRDKQMPIEAFQKFEPFLAKRGRSNLPTVRVETYDEAGRKSSYFDFAVGHKGWNAKDQSANMFFPGQIPQPGETWLLVEGCKDAAALVGLGYLAAGMPTNSLNPKFANLFAGCDVVLVPDLDSAGQSGSQITGGRLLGIAKSVRVARLPGEIVEKSGHDVRDVLRLHGVEKVRQSIESALPFQPRETGDGSDEGKPEVVLTSNLSWAVDEVSKHLGQLGRESNWIPVKKRERLKVYQRADELVQVVIEQTEQDVRGIQLPSGTARIRPLPTPQLVLRISDCCKLIREKETEDGLVRTNASPEKWLVDGVATRGYWESIPKLQGVITSPTIRPDGTIFQTPGYDERTGLLFISGKAKFPSVPDKPTQQDAIDAVGQLLEVVADFPFENESSRSAWVALVLTLIGRPAIRGCCPLFAIDANIRGAGKSLLADAASIIAYGRPAARKTFPSDDNETRKTITAIALEGLPNVLLDNIDSILGGASLDAAITAETWSDRILGSNRTTGELPLKAVFMATGNNLRYGSDLARRVLPIRLSPQVENPEERTGFQHSNLLAWVTDNRGRLAVAALTILRGYHVAGMPEQPGGQWGSFESWSKLIRNAIVWTGLGDPLKTRDIAKADDHSAAIVAGLIGGLIEIDLTGDGITAREIVKTLADSDADKFPTMREVASEIATYRGSIDPRRLGNQLKKFRGRVVKGYKLHGRADRTGVIRWLSVKAGAGSAGSAGSTYWPIHEQSGVVVDKFNDDSHIYDNYKPHGDGAESDPAHPAHPAVTCPKCGGSLYRKPETPMVAGWVNLDCECGHVQPVQVSGAGR